MHPRRPSDKTPEELAAQRALRLQLRIARALLREDSEGSAVDEAVRTLRETLRNPKVRRATKDHAAAILLSNANKAAGNNPSVTLQQGAIIDAAALLRLVGADTTTGPLGISQPAIPLDDPGIPTRCMSEGGSTGGGVLPEPTSDLRPVGPEVTPDCEPEDGPPVRVSSGDAPEATPPAPAQRNYLACPRCGARTDDEPGHDAACPVPKED